MAKHIKKVSTKVCNVCGDTRLVLLRTHNLKICSNCGNEIYWPLDNGQKPLR